MSDPKLEDVKKAKKEWENGTYANAVSKHGERRNEFVTTSSVPIKPLHTPDDIA